jgi:CRP/FNR family transcriptional regulator, nitrogen oxide reductase regulator
MINMGSTSAVAESTFLSGLDPAATRAFLGSAKLRRIPAKHAIATRGDQATNFFLIRSGHVRYYHLTKHGDLVLLGQLVPGNVVGLVTLLKGPSTYMASAEATSDCQLLAWDHAVVRSFVHLYPLLAENGLRIALGYLKHYIERHVGLVTETAEERLARTLLKLGQQTGAVHPDGVEIRATNSELSALADISRFTASRVLNDWVRAGTVSKERGRILLHAPEALIIA